MLEDKIDYINTENEIKETDLNKMILKLDKKNEE
jgi:hypothetical protein